MSYEFGSTVDEYAGDSKKPKFRKTEFLKLDEGEHRIRILEPQETKKYTHYVGFSYLECLGEECPICENNKRILYEHPEDYKDVTGWQPKSQRFYINVLDKTGEVPTVKVLSMSKTLLEDIKIISNSVRTKQDERVDIRMYDFILYVTGSRQTKEIRVAHKWYPGDEALEDVKEDALFDLSNVAVRLTPEEMLDAHNGASLKDIFALRRAKKEALEAVKESSVQEDMQSAVDELFNQ